MINTFLLNANIIYGCSQRSLHGQESIGSVNCVILIDSLCDSELHRPDQGDTIATFIAKHLELFPSWLKVVCTVRSSMAPTGQLGFGDIEFSSESSEFRVASLKS